MTRAVIYTALLLYGLAAALFYFTARAGDDQPKGYTQEEAEAIGALSIAAMAQGTVNEPEAKHVHIRTKQFYDRVPEYDTSISITPVKASEPCQTPGYTRYKGKCYSARNLGFVKK